ncbi:hypothetical protein BSP109_03071 [Brevibacterium sp. Mu109]|nr:hypothetical protein BSP109_03071 [Brevibacterium sp. Mu109]
MSLIKPIERAPLEGDEAIEGIPDTYVHDFWRFALPNLQVNTARGWFAEFLGKLLGSSVPSESNGMITTWSGTGSASR